MKLISSSSLLMLFAFSGIIFISCNKNKEVNSIVQIANITPDSGPYSTIVTITGTGFSTNTSLNQVKFNGEEAVVQSATSTRLTVEVPKGAGTGPVSVSVGDQNATGPDFNFTFTVNVSTLAYSHFPWGICVDSQGNVYTTDTMYHSISKITPEGVVSVYAGTGITGFADGTVSSAKFSNPMGLTIDSQDNIYVADTYNHRIRKITPAGVVSTIAGDGTPGFADGPGSQAEFSWPEGITIDSKGNIYVADTYNHRIRKITPTGVVSTLAGNGNKGFADGSASSSEFNTPWGIAVDSQENVYVADVRNNRIRKITPAGLVSTLAGNGTLGLADGPASLAEFRAPYGVCVDDRGNIFVADTWNNRICAITQKGFVSTLAGGTAYGYEDGPANSAKFRSPYAICVDKQGNIYVGDSSNGRVRKITVE